MAKKNISISKNAIYLMIEPIVFGVIGIVVSGYVARNIGVKEFGKLSFALAFINFLTLFTNFGFNNYLMNEFSSNKDNPDHIFIPVVLIRFFLGLITYFSGVLFIYLLGYPYETRVVYYAAGLIVFPIYLQDTCEGLIKGKEQMQYIAYLKIIFSVLLHATRVIVVYYGFKAYELAWTRVIVLSLTMILGFHIVYKKYIKFKISFNYSLYKEIIIKTLPFAFSTSFLIIYQRFDILMLSYLANDDSVAYYKCAHLFIEKLSILTIAIVGAVYPAISRLYSSNKLNAINLYNKTFFYLFLLSLPIAVGRIYISKHIIILIYGTEYKEAILVSKILFSNIPVLYATNIMGNVLMASEYAKVFTYVMTSLCISTIVTNIVFIPLYAHNGAALATLISQLINLFILLFVTNYYFGKLNFNFKYINIIIATLCMGIFLHYYNELNILTIIPSGMVIYGIVILSLGTFNKNELKSFIDLVWKRKKTL